jgi:hypothetical protein
VLSRQGAVERAMEWAAGTEKAVYPSAQLPKTIAFVLRQNIVQDLLPSCSLRTGPKMLRGCSWEPPGERIVKGLAVACNARERLLDWVVCHSLSAVRRVPYVVYRG